MANRRNRNRNSQLSRCRSSRVAACSQHREFLETCAICEFSSFMHKRKIQRSSTHGSSTFDISFTSLFSDAQSQLAFTASHENSRIPGFSSSCLQSSYIACLPSILRQTNPYVSYIGKVSVHTLLRAMKRLFTMLSFHIINFNNRITDRFRTLDHFPRIKAACSNDHELIKCHICITFLRFHHILYYILKILTIVL